MKKLFASIILSSLTFSLAFAQSFEGVIEFKKTTTTDTVNYIYYIKGDKIRVDEIGTRSKKVEGSYLIDTKAGSLIALSHDRKLYIEQATGNSPAIAGKPEVKKTGNTKKILGQNCSEYIVKNPDEKVQVNYWLASGKYDFFQRLLKILNRKDKSAVYYQLLTDVDGMFPFLSTQLNLETNEVEVKMETTKVDKKTVDAGKFEIPKEYQKFQK